MEEMKMENGQGTVEDVLEKAMTGQEVEEQVTEAAAEAEGVVAETVDEAETVEKAEPAKVAKTAENTVLLDDTEVIGKTQAEDEAYVNQDEEIEVRGLEQNLEHYMKVGKVKLDLSLYPGEDFYSDGQVEEELLNMVQNLSPVEYDKAIGESRNWPILYHLSKLRENIVEWIPMKKTDKVLEIGSGCGAVTGAFAKKAGSVTCVELSKRRSMINAYRHSECENVTIHVGNFRDIEPALPNDFDYICLVGVFEYAQSYIGGQTPFHDFLNILLPHLSPEGRVIIAIENKYGMKYFAGCKEDHCGSYFGGIENYPTESPARTFSRRGLERIFRECGVNEYHFYYPYPDYKFMHTLYSDAYLPSKGELCDNIRNFDRDRMVLFDEKRAFDGVVEDGYFSVFANSFLAVLGKDYDVKYVKYSNDRAREYAIKTEISKAPGMNPVVRKYPQTEEAIEHVKNMVVAYESLEERYRGSKLAVNKCVLSADPDNVYAEFEFIPGDSLLDLMNRCIDRGDLDGFKAYFKEYITRIGYNSDMPVADFDMVFSNILVQDDIWTLIDYEWTFGKVIEPKELAFRAVYYLARDEEKQNKLQLDWILDELGISQAEAEGYWQQELDFQHFVAGDRVTMAQMRDLIGRRLMVPQQWIERYGDAKDVNQVQIYEDKGEGYKEEESYFVRDAYQGDNEIELTLNVSGDVKMLRIDPAMGSCIVKILEMTFNGERAPLEKHKFLIPNGRIMKPADKKSEVYQPGIVFPTTDPNLNIDLQGLDRKGENVLYTRMKITQVPLEIAEDMFANVKRLI